MRYYHACSEDTFYKILYDQKIKRGFDGLVYLCEKPEESARFLITRGIKDIYIIGVDLDSNTVEQSTDHSEKFFKCKAYCVNYDIESDKFAGYLDFNI